MNWRGREKFYHEGSTEFFEGQIVMGDQKFSVRGPLINFHYEGSLTVSLYVGCKVRLAIFVFCLVVLATSGLRYILT